MDGSIMDNTRIQQFLKNISKIESSGGKNLNHPEMQRGIHAGDRAIGQYGLMPNTIQEIINRQKSDNSITPEIDELQYLRPEQLRNVVQNNPDVENNLASYLANRVLNNQNGNEAAAAFAWNQGSNLPPDRITSDKLLGSDYVRKFTKMNSNDAVNKLNEQQDLKDLANQRALALLANK